MKKFYLHTFVAILILGVVSFLLPPVDAQSHWYVDITYLVLCCAALVLIPVIKFRFGRVALLLIAAWWLGSMGWTVRELLRDHGWTRLIAIAIQIAILIRIWRDYRRLSTPPSEVNLSRP